jgi:RHS repeat-associated protein
LVNYLTREGSEKLMSSAVATARSTKHTRHLPRAAMLERATYDMNKNKTAETIGGVMQPYGYVATYDDDDRLATWTRDDTNLTQSWNLSPVGDWSSFTENSVVQNRTHELTAINSTPMTYDAKGNLTTNSNGQTYTWGFDNKMQSATVPVGCSDGIEGTHGYGYDALGRRVTKTVETDTRVFVCRTQPIKQSRHAGQVLAEYLASSTSANPSEQYVFASYIDEPVLKEGTGGDLYYHQNSLFNVVALSAATGTVLERYGYLAYGALSVRDASGTDILASTFANFLTYTGRRFDRDSGLKYYRARYRAVDCGRFIERDPILYQGSQWNVYEYVDNQPLNRIDPAGLED